MRDIKIGFAKVPKNNPNRVGYMYWRSQTTFFCAAKIIGNYWFTVPGRRRFQNAITHESIHIVLFLRLGRGRRARKISRGFDKVFGQISSIDVDESREPWEELIWKI